VSDERRLMYTGGKLPYSTREPSTQWFPALSSRPAGAQIRPGAQAKKYERKELALVRAAGTSQPTGAITARIVNPSRRLTCSWSIVFESDAVVEIDTWDAASVMTARACSFDSGREVLEHVLQNAVALPTGYEMDSLVSGVRIVATLGIPLDAAAAVVPGSWILKVTWEPDQPLCDDEVVALYSQCAADCVPVRTPLVP
jgi:hypothetical protein